MSIEAISWALNVDVGHATRKLVLIGYANHAHKDGRHAYAGKGLIADYANCDAKTVQRQVKPLIADGWMREGDQSVVEHLRADRRPVAYELAMTEAQRGRWQAAAAAGDSSWASEQRADAHWRTGGQPAPSSHESRRDSVSPRPDTHGGTHGGTSETPRGDTAMSPEPSGTIEPLQVVSVSQSPTTGRATTGLTDDDIERIRIRLQTLTPDRVIAATFARQVATQILTRAQATVANPLRYVLAGIDSEPTAYRPTPGPPTKTACCPIPGHGSYPATSCGACRADRIAGHA